jgi:16S rRNA A1518/A1519 N6-dimethyltransferase RsmA/KsgA/DIM1 with predicted DNA glycosylase/AP lyase activity
MNTLAFNTIKMTRFFAASNTFESTKVISLLLTFCCHLFIKISTENGKITSKTTRVNLFGFIVIILCGIYTFVDLMRQPYQPDPQITSIVLQMTVYIKFRLNVLQTVASIVCCFVYRGKFVRILKDFCDVDEKVRSKNKKIN